jgi:hypothetical protein
MRRNRLLSCEELKSAADTGSSHCLAVEQLGTGSEQAIGRAVAAVLRKVRHVAVSGPFSQHLPHSSL